MQWGKFPGKTIAGRLDEEKEPDAQPREFTFISINAGSLEFVGQRRAWDKHTVTVQYLTLRPHHKAGGTKQSKFSLNLKLKFKFKLSKSSLNLLEL